MHQGVERLRSERQRARRRHDPCREPIETALACRLGCDRDSLEREVREHDVAPELLREVEPGPAATRSEVAQAHAWREAEPPAEVVGLRARRVPVGAPRRADDPVLDLRDDAARREPVALREVVDRPSLVPPVHGTIVALRHEPGQRPVGVGRHPG